MSPEQRAAMAELGKGFKPYAKIATETLGMKSAGIANAAAYIGTLDERYKGNQALVASFVKQQLDSTHASVAEAEAESAVRRRNARIAGLSLTLLALCASLSCVFSRANTQPLRRAVELAGALAISDLSVRDNHNGSDATWRVLSALDEVARNLATLVADIRGTAEQISSASGEIASGNADLSSRTESTASALQQAASSIEQLATTIRSNADNARDANGREIRTLIGSSVEQIDAGAMKAQAAGQTMNRIIDAIERVSGTVDDISRAAAEQAAGIAQVNQSVADMDNSTQQNAAMVEEATAATEAVNGQSQRLVHLLTGFRTATA